MITRRLLSIALNAALFTGATTLVGCNQQPSGANASAPAGSSTAAAIQQAPAVAQAAPAYTPPTADQLYQMVAPIALFPDKLVAQVLAGSTYPDQITAADKFLEQNQSLQGAALQDAVDPQSWDPSIKGLTVFPKVLDQMAQNIPWTTALGTTYANDPTDVLNAIQVMRQRASKHGTLRSSAKLRVVDQPVTTVGTSYAAPPPDDGYEQAAYSGPVVVARPQQTIEILPADDDTVYVPQYDPQTVYGEEVQTYPTYSYDEPGYSRGDLVTTGAIAFGAGIVIATLFEHHHHDRPSYGWNSWDMQWRGDRDRDDHDHDGRDNRDRWQRPAVVHNNTVYETRSTTINNHYVTNNINNSVNNSNNRNTFNRPAPPMIQREQRLVAAAAGPVSPPNRTAHFNMPAQLPINRPNFNGALSKGEPARFARVEQAGGNRLGASVVPGEPNETRRGNFGTPGVTAPGANRAGMPHATPVAVDTRHARVNMPVESAPTANRPDMPRIRPNGQPNRLGQRGESMRVPGQHTFTAAPTPAPHTAVPVERPMQRVSAIAPRSLPATPQRAEMRQHEFSRATPVQSQRVVPERERVRPMPMAAPQPREASRQQTQREIARPQMPMDPPRRREAPREQPQREFARPQMQQAQAAPRPQMAPRPAAEQHRSAPAKNANEQPKRDEKNH